MQSTPPETHRGRCAQLGPVGPIPDAEDPATIARYRFELVNWLQRNGLLTDGAMDCLKRGLPVAREDGRNATVESDITVHVVTWEIDGCSGEAVYEDGVQVSSVSTCGHKHECPVCAARDGAQNAGVINDVLFCHFGRNLSSMAGSRRGAYLVTLGNPNRQGQSLGDHLDWNTATWSGLTGGRNAARLLGRGNPWGVIGWVSVVEVTHSPRNGWNVHRHVLVLTDHWLRGTRQLARFESDKISKRLYRGDDRIGAVEPGDEAPGDCDWEASRLLGVSLQELLSGRSEARRLGMDEGDYWAEVEAGRLQVPGGLQAGGGLQVDTSLVEHEGQYWALDGNLDERLWGEGNEVGAFWTALFETWASAAERSAPESIRASGAPIRPLIQAQDMRSVPHINGLGGYLQKLGSGMEVAGGATKQGRGSGSRAPFQIAWDLYQYGLNRDLALWWEYVRAMEGRRSLAWSSGGQSLRKIYQVEEDPPERPAVKGQRREVGRVLAANVRPWLWRTFAYRGLVPWLLEALRDPDTRACMAAWLDWAGRLPPATDNDLRDELVRAIREGGVLKGRSPEHVPILRDWSAWYTSYVRECMLDAARRIRRQEREAA